jgi:hypothetical protein
MPLFLHLRRPRPRHHFLWFFPPLCPPSGSRRGPRPRPHLCRRTTPRHLRGLFCQQSTAPPFLCLHAHPQDLPLSWTSCTTSPPRPHLVLVPLRVEMAFTAKGATLRIPGAYPAARATILDEVSFGSIVRLPPTTSALLSTPTVASSTACLQHRPLYLPPPPHATHRHPPICLPVPPPVHVWIPVLNPACKSPIFHPTSSILSHHAVASPTHQGLVRACLSVEPGAYAGEGTLLRRQLQRGRARRRARASPLAHAR